MGKLVGNSEFRERLAAARPRLYRTALAWTRNRDMAEDLVQGDFNQGTGKIEATP